MARKKKKIRVGLSSAQSQVQSEGAGGIVQELCLQTKTVATAVGLPADGVHLLPIYPHLSRTRKGNLSSFHRTRTQ